MSKRDNLMDYIFTTPGNMNPVILNQKIDETVSEEGSVTPTGTIQITENDTYDVTNYASAEVNVPGITPAGTLQITENDTYDVTNYASAEVNVSGGTSDFTTCTVTFAIDSSNPPLGEYSCTLGGLAGIYDSSFIYTDPNYTNESGAENTAEVVLYKGAASGGVYLDNCAVTFSGNATFSDDVLSVTGDFTATISVYQN